MIIRTGKFNQEPQLLFRWFFFRLYILSALLSPEEYGTYYSFNSFFNFNHFRLILLLELFEEVSTAQKLALKSVERVLAHVTEVPSSFPSPLHTRSLSTEDETLCSFINTLVL